MDEDYFEEDRFALAHLPPLMIEKNDTREPLLKASLALVTLEDVAEVNIEKLADASNVMTL